MQGHSQEKIWVFWGGYPLILGMFLMNFETSITGTGKLNLENHPLNMPSMQWHSHGCSRKKCGFFFRFLGVGL